jgi:predicted dehydrogenase
MNTIGVIGSKVIETNAFATEFLENRKDLIKIYSEGKNVYINKDQFPFTEVVENLEEIIHDQAIDTVFVSEQKISFISSALKAGKTVRVI